MLNAQDICYKGGVVLSPWECTRCINAYGKWQLASTDCKNNT